MKVMIDTCIWSYALRHRAKHNAQIAAHSFELAELIKESRVCLIGPIRQEILSGLKSESQFNILRDKLRQFSDTEILIEDHEIAAAFYNQARSKGIQASNTDFLICAVSCRLQYPIYSTDGDFKLLASRLPIKIYSPREKR